MLIDLVLDKIMYYSFIISMDGSDWSYNTNEDPFGRICVLNKMEDVNLEVFTWSKGINELKTLPKHILCECKCRFDCTNKRKIKQ